MGNTFTMLLGTGLVLTALVLAFKKPLLYLFGASDATFPMRTATSPFICAALCS